MALGVNAHVNNDIPQVLLDCHTDTQHRADYNRVNAIIASSLDEILDGFKRPMLVRIWRWTAWHKFRRLEQGGTSVKELEHTAESTGRVVSKLPV